MTETVTIPDHTNPTERQFEAMYKLMEERPDENVGQYKQRHGIPLDDEAAWSAFLDRKADELEAAREELFETRRAEATRRYREILDRYYEGTEYSGSNPPIYKASAAQRQPREGCPGQCLSVGVWRYGPDCGHDGQDAPERTSSIRQLMDEMQYDQPDYLQPLVGFDEVADWSGADLRERSFSYEAFEPIKDAYGNQKVNEAGQPLIKRVTRFAEHYTWPNPELCNEVDERGLKDRRPVHSAQVDEALIARHRVRVSPLIAQANGQHERQEHATGAHPWCELCELRRHRSAYLNEDLDHFHLSDQAVMARYREDVEARVLGALVRDSGRVPTFSPRQPAEEGNPWTSLDDLLNQEAPGFLFAGVIPEHGLGYLTGRDGTYKTFLALDLAMHLVTDEDNWHGREVGEDYGAEVVFVAGEGAHSFGKRIQAWLTEHETGDLAEDAETLREASQRLHIRSGSVNLYTGGPAYDDLLKVCEERQPALVVIDTLQTNATGAESNSASDMGEVTARLQALKEASQGTILVLAHTGKSDQDARGSSSIEDDADFVLHIKPDNADLALKVAKQKDGDSGFTIELKATPAHGSVVIRTPGEIVELDSGKTPRTRILGALRELLVGHPFATTAQIRQAVAEDITGLGALSRTSFYRTLDEMVDEDLVVKTERGAKGSYEFRLDASHPDACI